MIKEIPLSLIDLPAWDVRIADVDEDLADLARSIADHGLLNPLTVVQNGDRYTVIAGRRRLRALRQLGITPVQCNVVAPEGPGQFVLGLVENIQRRQMSPIEEAMALAELKARCNATDEQIASWVGRSRPYVTNRLRLLKADPETAAAVHRGDITAGHAEELMRIENPEWRHYYLSQTIEYGFSVASLRYLVDQYLATVGLPEAPAQGRAMEERPATQHTIQCQVCQMPVPSQEIRTMLICQGCMATIRQAMEQTAGNNGTMRG
jgi:ParB family chromosome partitioning protein